MNELPSTPEAQSRKGVRPLPITAACMVARGNTARTIFASMKSAVASLAAARIESVRSAPVRSAPLRSAEVRIA